jgi:ABC-type microcin C transport system duplicated ATPase subunit YejF
MSEATLQFDQLRVAFAATEVVHGLSFTIEPGQVVALVGESGSGKSVSAMSVLRLLQEPPANYPGGRILWRGEDVLRMDAKRLRRLRGGEVGMVFQEPMTALNPTMTVGAQVEEALQIHTTLDAAARNARVVELFRAVGIPQPESRVAGYPHEMSGGQRQRVCIAMALACEPSLLIADEPTTALDVTIQAQILDLLKQLQRSRGLSVLFITHDFGLVRELADRVVVMRNGEAVEQGTVTEVFAAPKHPYTRGLLTCKPILGKRVARLTTVADVLAGA